MNPKVFVAVTALGGGCVGLSLYLWKANSFSQVTNQPNTSAIVPAVAKAPVVVEQQEKQSTSKGECEITELPADIQGFLTEQQKHKGDYVSFSCSNTSLKTDYMPLPSGWIGWSPKFVFADEPVTTSNKKFEINTETHQEETDWGSITKITLSGSGLKSTLKGKWERIEQTKIKQTVTYVKISGGGQGNDKIYLFLPLLNVEDSQEVK